MNHSAMKIMLALAAACSASASLAAWQHTGPQGGDTPVATFISSTPGRVIALGGNTLYRSTNDGASWQEDAGHNPNGLTSALGIDPANRNRALFKGATGVFRTLDGGSSFLALGHPSTAADAGQTSSLAVSADGRVVYAGTDTGQVFSSSDFGSSWTRRGSGLPTTPGHRVTQIAVSAQTPTKLFAAINFRGIYRSLDGGASWTLLTGISCSVCPSVVVDPGNDNLVLAGVDQNVQRSSDGGNTWSESFRAPGGGGPDALQLAFDASGSKLYLTSYRTQKLHISSDDGASWSDGASVVANVVYGLAVDALRTGRLLVASSEGPLFSADGGLTLSRRQQGIYAGTFTNLLPVPDGTGTIGVSGGQGPTAVFHGRPGGAWNAMGLASMVEAGGGRIRGISGLTYGGESGSEIYASTVFRLLKSSDRGEHWALHSSDFAPSGSGGFGAGSAALNNITLDPTSPGTVFAATGERGILKSVDGGVHFTDSSEGLPTALVCTIVFDPVRTDTLYAGTYSGLFRSSNHGSTWSRVDVPGANEVPGCHLRFDPRGNGRLFYAADSGLYRSVDHGSSWVRLRVPQADNVRVNDVVIDGQRPDTVYAAQVASNDSVFRSVDGGDSWQPMPWTRSGSRAADLLLLDPANRHRVLAAVSFQGLLEQEVTADLSLVASSSPTPFVAQQPQFVQLQVSSVGPYAATTVELSATLPITDARDVSVQSSRGSCRISGVNLACTLSALAVGESFSVRINFTPTREGSASLSSSAKAEERDAALGDETASASYSVMAAPTAPPPVSGGTSSGSGGGVSGLSLMLVMVLMAVAGRKRRRQV